MDEEETVDDLEPGRLAAEVVEAMEEFPDMGLPYEAVVYEEGEIDRGALAKMEAARLHSEFIHGTALVERDVEPDEENPERITVRVLDPTELVLDENGEVVHGEQ